MSTEPASASIPTRVLFGLSHIWGVLVLVGMNLSSLPLLKIMPDPEYRAFTGQALEMLRPYFGGPVWVVAWGLGLVGAGLLLRRVYRQVSQSRSDREASLALDGLREGKTPPRDIFLYLRAFETTGKLKTPLFMFDLQNLGLLQWRRSELEHLIGRALKKDGLLVALGHPGESMGAGRIDTSEERWKDDIAVLASAAKGILLIPSNHSGTVWEIDHLQHDGLLPKTVFLMPPESRKFNWKAHWWESRSALGALGSRLPEYNELGLLFTLAADGALRNAEPFSLSSERAFRKAVHRLLSAEEPKKGAMAAMARAEKRARRTRSFYRFNFFGRLAGTAVAIPVLILSALYIPASQSPVMTARDRLHNSPVYQARVKGLSEEQATDLVGDLAAKGVRRLDDHALVARLSAYASMLSNADESTCEAMADGTVTVEQMTQVITNLNQPQKTDFIETNEMAALAELEQVPPPTVSSQEVDQAMEQFVATLSPVEVRRLTAYADSKATQPPREVCFWQRKYFGSIAILPEPHKHVMARFLAEHAS